MITIKTPDEIERMRKSGALLRQVLDALRERIQPGVTTMELDRFAETMIRDLGAIPSCKGYEGFPYTLCTSVDDEVVHGFPNDKPLKEGSLLSIDTVLCYDGWMADSAFTAPVGEVSAEVKKLIRVTEECFFLGASQARTGNRISDISRAVQKHAENAIPQMQQHMEKMADCMSRMNETALGIMQKNFDENCQRMEQLFAAVQKQTAGDTAKEAPAEAAEDVPAEAAEKAPAEE